MQDSDLEALFMLALMALACFMALLAMAALPMAPRKGDDEEGPCPPHKWTTRERDGKLVCGKRECGFEAGNGFSPSQ